jgi:hypothetical protein
MHGNEHSGFTRNEDFLGNHNSCSNNNFFMILDTTSFLLNNRVTITFQSVVLKSVSNNLRS